MAAQKLYDRRFADSMEVKELAERWGMSVSAVHRLVKRQGQRVLGFHFVDGKMYVSVRDIYAWEANPTAQARSRRRNKQLPPKTTHSGPAPGHNSLPDPAGPGLVVYAVPGGKVHTVEISQKHITVNPGETPEVSPDLSTYVVHDGGLTDPSTGHTVDPLDAQLAEESAAILRKRGIK
jgi:hypothetical protein